MENIIIHIIQGWQKLTLNASPLLCIYIYRSFGVKIHKWNYVFSIAVGGYLQYSEELIYKPNGLIQSVYH
jgi:hypothetical protein